MTGFWDGITGEAEDAYTKTFADVLPNNTTALATIVSCKNKQHIDSESINVEWEIMEGDFAGQHVFQKIHAYDKDVDKATKGRNMLKFLLVLFHVKPTDNTPPTDRLLSQLQSKVAGIKIQEWSMKRDDGTIGHGNFISEVHPSTGFVTQTGKYREFKHKTTGVESALTRNAQGVFDKELDDDIPF